jgi:HSP20 family molecular chaperone IbpA
VARQISPAPAFRQAARLQGHGAITIFSHVRLPKCGIGQTASLVEGPQTVTKLTLGSHPYMLGFEQLERLVERTSKADLSGYPPFNIEQRGENAYRITLAVAGFREEDLSVTVEDRQLVIRGRQTEEDDGRIYLHRGIAARQFQKAFVLAEGVDVAGAQMENGLLHVDLRRSPPQTVVKTIKIGRK